MKVNPGILTALLFLIVTFVPAKAHAEDLLKRVNDAPTARALKTFNKKIQKIRSKCNNQAGSMDMSKASECMCKNISEIMKANQVKLDAFLDLMKRRPELVKEMVKVEGVFGNWYLDPDDPAVKNRDNLNFWKKRYNCP